MRRIVKRAALLAFAATFAVGLAVNLNPMNVLAVQQAKMPILATEGIVSGTLGENDGFSYTYDADTKTLTVTGEDSGLDLSQVGAEAEKIILSDCKVIGSADFLFENLSNLQSVEFDNFDTSEITSMRYMFSGCEELSKLELSGFDTGNVEDMQLMFCNCSSLQSLDLSSFDTSNAASVREMFEYCDSLKTVSAPKNMAEEQSIELPFLFGDENENYTDKLTAEFCNKTLEKGIPSSGTLGENGGFSFSYDRDTKTLTVTGQDSGLYLRALAAEAEKIVLKNCKLVGSANSLFSYLTKLQSVEFDNFDTSEITDMGDMFYACTSLGDLDVSGFDTRSVTNMQNMFGRCECLETVDLSSFDTTKVDSLLNLFYGCINLKSVDLSSFDTTNVSRLGGIFIYCNTLDTISAPKAMAEGQSIELPYTFYDSERNSTEEITSAWCGKDLSIFLKRTGTMGDNNGFSYIYNETTRALTVTGEDSGLDLSEVKTELLELDLSGCVIQGDVTGLLKDCNNLEVIYTPKQLAEGQSIALPDKFCDANWNIIEEVTSKHCNEVLKSAVRIELEYIYINTEGDNSQYLDNQYVPIGTVWGEFFEKYEKCFGSGVITDADETITAWKIWIQNTSYDSEEDYYENTIRDFNQYTDCALVRFMGIPSGYKNGYVAFEYLVDGKHVDSGTGWDMILPAEYAYGSDEVIAYVTRNLKIHQYIMDYCNTPGATVTITAPWPPASEWQWDGYSVTINVETPEAKLQAFVERMYTVALGRDAEEEGVAHWVGLLQSGASDGEDIAVGFFAGEEFIGRDLSDEEYLEVLYATFFDREADEEGWNYNMGLLQSGASRDTVLAVFIASGEFETLCSGYGIEAVLTQEELVTSFVERMYTVALDRTAEADGVAHWVGLLLGGDSDGEDVAVGFFNGEEFVGRNLSDEDYLEVLYATLFDREADAEGWDYNMGLLESGVSREVVLAGFINSNEFDTLCIGYGIEAVYTQDELVRSFVDRMYTAALGRDAEEEGAAYWTAQLLAGNITGAAVANDFISGEEFVNRGLSDREYVEVLYTTFFNREGAEADIEYWMGVAASNRRTVLVGFAGSEEFKGLCEKYGITVGTIQ